MKSLVVLVALAGAPTAFGQTQKLVGITDALDAIPGSLKTWDVLGSAT